MKKKKKKTKQNIRYKFIHILRGKNKNKTSLYKNETSVSWWPSEVEKKNSKQAETIFVSLQVFPTPIPYAHEMTGTNTLNLRA